MASTLDKALDDVIKEKRSSRRSNDSRSKRSSGPSTSRGAGGAGGAGGIRKRNIGSSSRLGATFVRTVQLRGNGPSVSGLVKVMVRMATDRLQNFSSGWW